MYLTLLYFVINTLRRFNTHRHTYKHAHALSPSPNAPPIYRDSTLSTIFFTKEMKSANEIKKGGGAGIGASAPPMVHKEKEQVTSNRQGGHGGHGCMFSAGLGGEACGWPSIALCSLSLSSLIHGQKKKQEWATQKQQKKPRWSVPDPWYSIEHCEWALFHSMVFFLCLIIFSVLRPMGANG